MSAPRIGRDEYVVTAWAERAAGPGWAHNPLWVLVGTNGVPTEMRVECIQPEYQTPRIVTLYAISTHVHGILTDEAEYVLTGGNK